MSDIVSTPGAQVQCMTVSDRCQTRLLVQAALATVQLYPWSCDVSAIAEAVAAEMGEPTLEQLLAEGAALG